MEARNILNTLESLDRKVRAGTRIFNGIACVCVIILFGLIFVNVFMRYLFESPFEHADELVRYINAWVVFFALAPTLRAGKHIAIVVFTSKLSDRVREKAEALGVLLVVVWVAMFAVGGWMLWGEMFISQERSYGLLEVELWIPGVCIIAGLSWFLVELVLDFCLRVARIANQSTAGDKGRVA